MKYHINIIIITLNMNINITHSTDKALLTHDPHGNIFLRHKDKTYYLALDEDNKPSLRKINLDKLIDLSSVKPPHGKIYSGVSTLKGAITDEIDKKNEEEPVDSDDEFIQEYNDKYFPEHKFCYKGKITDNEYSDDSDNDQDLYNDPIYRFYGLDEKFMSKMGFQFNSIYEFLIIDGNIDSKDIILMSEEYGGSPLYRINIYTDGILKCNVIGSGQSTYTISLKEDNLVISHD